MGRTRCNYNYGNSGRQVFFDGATFETLHTHFPVNFMDDFLGAHFQKVIANENTVAPWDTVATDINLAPLLVEDEPNGVVQITLDADDITQQGAIYWSDELTLDVEHGLIWEARVKFAVLPTAGGGENSRAVFGVASATGADLDAIAINAWFRVESAAQTVLLYESDDATTDDDDNTATGITLAALVWHIFQIDFTDLSAVRFVVDGTCVGTTDMSAIAAPAVQPYFCMSKTKAAANTAIGTMYIDYVRCFQNRD